MKLTPCMIALLAACHDAPPPPAPPPVAAKPVASDDARKPLPLTAMMAEHQKREMRDHLRVVQEIVTALATDDFDAIEKSAKRIAWSEKEAMMCKHMGAGAPGFLEVGEHFHKTADGIVDAAKHRDRVGVTKALAATVQTCVGCHDTFRQELVDHVEDAPSMEMHGM